MFVRGEGQDDSTCQKKKNLFQKKFKNHKIKKNYDKFFLNHGCFPKLVQLSQNHSLSKQTLN